MDSMTWEKVAETQGRLDADLVESFLEAHGIDVELIQESLGHSAIPVTINGLGRVQIFVAKENAATARDLLKDLESIVSMD